jgi:transcriptional regulator with XRE-family HTH domain
VGYFAYYQHVTFFINNIWNSNHVRLNLAKNTKIYFTSKMKETFGEFIRKNRNVRRLTQTQFAAQIGIDAAAVSKIEKGKAVLNKEKLPALATLFKMDLKTLKEEYFSEKIAHVLYNNKCSENTLVLAEQKMQYIKSKKVKQMTLKLE